MEQIQWELYNVDCGSEGPGPPGNYCIISERVLTRISFPEKVEWSGVEGRRGRGRRGTDGNPSCPI